MKEFTACIIKTDVKYDNDGITIRKDAFDKCIGKTVPVVWHEMLDNPENQIGVATLTKVNDDIHAVIKLNNNNKATRFVVDLCFDGSIHSFNAVTNNLLLNISSNEIISGDIKQISFVLRGCHGDPFISRYNDHYIIACYDEVKFNE